MRERGRKQVLERRSRGVLAICLGICAALAGCPDHTAPHLIDRDGAVPEAAPHDLIPTPDRAADFSLGDLPHTGNGPPYPIVLVHGFFGFEKIGPINYFWKVKDALAANGHVVAVAALDPFNSTIKVRGPQLLQQIELVLGQTGADRVNIIAHSQGGLDARFVAAKIPGRVAAVVTISTPHQGTAVADVLLQKTPGFSQALAVAFVKAVARPFYGDISKDTNLVASLESFTTASMTAFNAAYPDQPAVSYFSLAGRSNSRLAATECHSPVTPAFLAKYAADKDPVDVLLWPTCTLLEGSESEPNDGMVRVKDARWGTWLGCVPADHFDEVGQLLGDGPGSGNPFDHIALYTDVANFLVTRGF